MATDTDILARATGSEQEHPTATTGPLHGASRSQPLAPGIRLGRYTILGMIGAGGMGAVYRAHDAELDRKVALKVLHDSAKEGVDRAARHRLLHEARAMAKLRHGNVITVHDVGTVTPVASVRDRERMDRSAGSWDSSPADADAPSGPSALESEIDFVAMELVDGCNLAEWLDTSPRTWREVVKLFLAAGRGLAAAHTAGLVHRDFKPANVLIGDDDRVLVTDFGLARSLGEGILTPPATDAGEVPADAREEVRGSAVSSSGDDVGFGATLHAEAVGLTRTGMVIGTPAYMAPEQHIGESIDARADQFGFCVSLYQGLYGKRPFAGDSIAELREAISKDGPPGFPGRPAVPRAIRRVITRGLAVEPGDRYPAMTDLLSALRRASRSRRRWLIAACALATFAIILVVGGAIGGKIERARQAAADQCNVADESFDTIWNDDIAASIEQTFLDSGSTCADSASLGLSSRLDRYRDSWLEVHAEVCQARDSEESAFHARVGCLLDQRTRFASLVALMRDADANMVEEAVEAVEALPSPMSCRDVVAGSGALRFESPDDRRVVAKLRHELAAADAMRSAGMVADSEARARAVADRARRMDYPVVVAEALLRVGEARARAGDRDGARTALEQAIHAGEAVSHAEIIARASVALAGLVMVEDEESQRSLARSIGRLREARKRHDQKAMAKAQSAVEKYRGDPMLDAKLARLEARAAADEAAYGTALEKLEHALADYRSAGKPLRAAAVLGDMSRAHIAQKDFQGALDRALDAERTLRRELGPEHLQVIASMRRTARLLRTVGDVDGARAHELHIMAFLASRRGLELMTEGRVERPASD